MDINIDFKAPLDFLTSIVKSIRIWWLKQRKELYWKEKEGGYWRKEGEEDYRCCSKCLGRDKNIERMKSFDHSPESFECPVCKNKEGKPRGKIFRPKERDLGV